MTDSTAGREEPRWPAIIALLSVSGLYWAMPEPLTPGPGWLVPAMAAPLSIAALLFHKRSRDHAAQVVGYVLSGIVTVALIGALALLIAALPNKTEAPRDLLKSVAALWVCNILVFAAWYWRLDGGGPHRRA